VRNRSVVLMIAGALLAGLVAVCPSAARGFPVPPGESIEFELRYLGGRGGYLTVTTDTDRRRGRTVRTTRLRVETTGTLGEFYSVDDRMIGYFDPETDRSLGYDFRENHGGDRDSETVRYHHDEGYYTEDGKRRGELEAGTLDLASALLALRSTPLEVGKRRRMTVQVTGDTYRVLMIPEGIEVLNVKGLKMRAVRVRIRPRDPEAYEEMKSWLTKDAEGIYLWVGTGPRRIPLRIRASTEIGVVEARLSRYRR